MSDVLLTIAIPTYNRAHLLNECLKSLAQEFGSYASVEIIVSNNASTDETVKVVKRYIESSIPSLIYLENDSNLGPDYNIAQCFREANGKYVWIFSDDDLLFPSYGKSLLNLLSSDEWGVIHLKGLWYQENKAPQILSSTMSYSSYVHGLEFIEQVHYWVTFITGNIINKSILGESELTYSFSGTSLIQLGWVLPAALAGKPNVIVDTVILACRAGNTGGYKLFEVFGRNFNRVLDSLTAKGYDKQIKLIINNQLITNFFPNFLVNRNQDFIKEKYLFVLLPVFWRYKKFWRIMFPMLIKNQFNIK